MRTKSAVAVAGIVAAAFTAIGPAAPAHACHDDIFISENPIHNGICWTIHDTDLEERIAEYYEQVYCTLKGGC